ncbi:hypothetical protein [Polaromonas sp.]|uniref:hypothetical protein n=1 Tax=Polaromonas sp. TaxID=1869339 RepID=UPI0032644454
MSPWTFFKALALSAMFAQGAGAAPRLDLAGYVDNVGAITVLHGGDSTDPYFAMQALLLAHDNGMDTSSPAEKFVNWLVPRQKPDGTFDRFCRGPDRAWVACKAADADDSLLALWMRLLETMPTQLAANPVWKKSHETSKASLEHLFQPSRGVYMVSPLVLHGLFMDNLEVWSLKAHRNAPASKAEAEKLARGIRATFWNPVDKRFLISTQLEQRAHSAAFYPDQVAQLFPLLVDFPQVPVDPKTYYRNWMGEHRAEWLRQGEKDYPWGLIAVLAMRQGDRASAGCWMLQAVPLRHSSRWAVTDEASYQILLAKAVAPAGSAASCS